MPIIAPTSPIDSRWSTRHPLRSVLAIAHNVTAATRLFDALDLIGDDDRMRVEFTCTGSSAFSDGTEDFLDKRGVRRVRWQTALARTYDLAVSASHGGELHLLEAPLLIIPHGMGYNKFLETGNRKPETGNRKPETGNRKPVFGLSADWLIRNGKVVPTTLLLSHIEQQERLRNACSQAIPHSLVAGDLCLDQLMASMSLRPSYRRALGLPNSVKLIVVSSTWGADSLLGKHLRLPQALAQELPADEYRVVVAAHPNIWHGHSVWQVRHWLTACERAGATVLTEPDDWKTAVISADIVVGDQGSVPFYSACVGLPVLFASAPAHTVAPDSPIAKLLSAAPLLTQDTDLRQQIAKVLANHSPDRYSDITALATSEPGRAAALLRAEMYRLLRLPEPASDVEADPLPLPTRPLVGPISYVVQVEVRDRSAQLTRLPAEGLLDGPAARGHLAVSVREPRHRWLELADVIIGVLGDGTSDWIADTLRRLPGCALAAAPESSGNWLLGDRKGTLLQVAGDGALFASAAYQALATGMTLASLTGRWQLSAGAETSVDVTLTGQ